MTQTDAQMLASRIQARAAHYFASTAPAEVTALSRTKGWNATVHFFEVALADQRHPVVAKTFHPRRRSTAGAPLPRVLQPPDWPSPGAREHAALARIEAGFSRLADPHLGAVRVLDHLADSDTLVMETHPGQGLDQLLRRRSRLRGGATGPLTAACRRAGAWLRAYHELPDMPDTPLAHTRRSELLDSVGELTARLSPGVREALRESVCHLIERRLPDPRQPVTLHGDFVPRNVLVDGESVVVFDTRAPWRAPPEFDLARFALSLKYGMGQALTRGRLHGRAVVAELEGALHEGYGATPALLSTLRVYEVVGLLEIWALARQRTATARGLRAPAKRARLRVLESFYASRLASLLREAGA